MAEDCGTECDTDEGIIEAIGAVISDGINDVSGVMMELTAAMATDPCFAAVQYGALWQGSYLGTYNQGSARLAALSSMAHRIVDLAVTKWGRPDYRYALVSKFSRYLLENNVIQADHVVALGLLFGGPIGAAVTAASLEGWVDSHLPPGSGWHPPSSTMGGGGLQISPGVSVAAFSGNSALVAFSQGHLQGPRIRAAWEDWVALVKMRASPFYYLSIRQKLTRLAGQPYGVWPFWQDGDPILSTSLLGKLLELRDYFQVLRDDAEAVCELNRDSARSNTDALIQAQIAGWGVQGQVDLETARAGTTLASAAPLLGWAAIAFALSRAVGGK